MAVAVVGGAVRSVESALLLAERLWFPDAEVAAPDEVQFLPCFPVCCSELDGLQA